MSSSEFRPDERGIALVMALMILLAISLLSVGMMMTLQVEKKMTGEASRYAKCLNLAEAGVGEALSHIRNSDIPNPINTNNPRMCAQVFLAPAGSLPNYLNTESLAVPTGQPAGTYMNYSSAGKGPDALTVTYKTDPTRTMIYRYDPLKVPPINYLTGLPIYVVKSTGRIGNTYRRVQAEVIMKPINASIKGALAVNAGIDFGGNAQVCGYNHSGTLTPNQTAGVHGAGPCTAFETGTGNLYGGWSGNTITSSGSSSQSGVPTNIAQNMLGFYAGPWEAVGFSQAEFFSWVGAPLAAMPGGGLHGIYYLDNNNITQDASGAWSVGGGVNDGFLYVDGDLTVNSNFVFRGLMYVEGDLKINGNCWILGSVIVKGKGRISNGSMVVLYSSEAVTTMLAKYGGQFTTLAWHEVP